MKMYLLFCCLTLSMDCISCPKNDENYKTNSSEQYQDTGSIPRLEDANPKPVFKLDPIHKLNERINVLYKNGGLTVRKITDAASEIRYVIDPGLEYLSLKSELDRLNFIENNKPYYVSASLLREGTGYGLYEKAVNGSNIGIILDTDTIVPIIFGTTDLGLPTIATKKACEKSVEEFDLELYRELRVYFHKADAKFEDVNKDIGIPIKNTKYPDVVRVEAKRQMDEISKDQSLFPKFEGNQAKYNEIYLHYEPTDLLGIIQHGENLTAEKEAKEFQEKLRQKFGVEVPIRVFDNDKGLL